MFNVLLFDGADTEVRFLLLLHCKKSYRFPVRGTGKLIPFLQCSKKHSRLFGRWVVSLLLIQYHIVLVWNNNNGRLGAANSRNFTFRKLHLNWLCMLSCLRRKILPAVLSVSCCTHLISFYSRDSVPLLNHSLSSDVFQMLDRLNYLDQPGQSSSGPLQKKFEFNYW